MSNVINRIIRIILAIIEIQQKCSMSDCHIITPTFTPFREYDGISISHHYPSGISHPHPMSASYPNSKSLPFKSHPVQQLSSHQP